MSLPDNPLQEAVERRVSEAYTKGYGDGMRAVEAYAGAQRQALQRAAGDLTYIKLNCWQMSKEGIAEAADEACKAIDAALAKNPNPSGHPVTEALPAARGEPDLGVTNRASGPVGLGPPTPLNLEMHKALEFYANRKNWNPVADYADGYWYIAGQPWMLALAALKDTGVDVDQTAPTDVPDPLDVGPQKGVEMLREAVSEFGEPRCPACERPDSKCGCNPEDLRRIFREYRGAVMAEDAARVGPRFLPKITGCRSCDRKEWMCDEFEDWFTAYYEGESAPKIDKSDLMEAFFIGNCAEPPEQYAPDNTAPEENKHD